jgi:DinB family protein
MAKKKKAGTKRKTGGSSRERALREHLVYLLKGGGAHVQFDDSITGLPARKRGTYAKGLPHTAWQLLEHLRLAQRDILEFSRNPKHVSPEWPDGYWPRTPGPQSDAAWEKSVREFKHDLREMVRLVENRRTDLLAKIPHGHGQTILREVLLLADHNSYHIGQLVDLRRALQNWPEE